MGIDDGEHFYDLYPKVHDYQWEDKGTAVELKSIIPWKRREKQI